MRKRYQKGTIHLEHGAWYGIYRDDVFEDGRVVRKQIKVRLADYGDRCRSQKDVRPLLDAILKPLNEGKASPEGNMTVADFFEKFFMPNAEKYRRPSTVNGYKAIWRMYLAPRLQNATVRNYRTVDAVRLLEDIYTQNGLGKKTLKHCKGLLSSIFSFAKEQGAFDGMNPIIGAGNDLLKRVPKPKPTHAASPEEVIAMLDALRGTARTAVALMFFCGLRPGEARGARWEDYDGQRLQIRQSVWRTFTTDPKTEQSIAPLPVCESLAAILNENRQRSGFILAGPTGKPTNLNNLARRVVIPTLREKGIPWYGWYSLRRGIATLLKKVEGAEAAKDLLRHAHLATTESSYIKIKDVTPEVRCGMEKVDALFDQQSGGQVQ